MEEKQPSKNIERTETIIHNNQVYAVSVPKKSDTPSKKSKLFKLLGLCFLALFIILIVYLIYAAYTREIEKANEKKAYQDLCDLRQCLIGYVYTEDTPEQVIASTDDALDKGNRLLADVQARLTHLSKQHQKEVAIISDFLDQYPKDAVQAKLEQCIALQEKLDEYDRISSEISTFVRENVGDMTYEQMYNEIEDSINAFYSIQDDCIQSISSILNVEATTIQVQQPVIFDYFTPKKIDSIYNITNQIDKISAVSIFNAEMTMDDISVALIDNVNLSANRPTSKELKDSILTTLYLGDDNLMLRLTNAVLWDELSPYITELPLEENYWPYRK